jgi:hypothetical protein
MIKWLGFIMLLLATSFLTCKTKKDNAAANGENSFFPAVSYIRGQAADIDTSLYRIIKIESTDSLVDTVFLKREEFRKYAKDFLELPDISSEKYRDDYQESKIYDDDLKSIILTYSTKERENEVQREDIMIEPQPDEKGNSKVKTIIIDKWSTKGDSTVHKNMVWETDKRFLIITKVQLNNHPEKIRKMEVVWNDYHK